MQRWAFLVVIVLAACGDAAPGAGGQSPAASASPPASPIALDHDFGVIPHGDKVHHEFALDLQRLSDTWVPLRVHLDCSCGHADLRLRARNGSERFVDASGSTTNLPRDGESLVLRVEIDSGTKEALDLPRTVSRGFVVLQLASDMTGSSRIQWPLQVGFGIEAPVLLRPFATLDFGRVPASGIGLLATTIRGDERHADASFGPATSADPAIAVELEKQGDHWLLRATCTPKELGNQRTTITVQNTIPGYHLELPTTWKVVPDLEVKPVAKLGFRTDLTREQTPEEARDQYLVVVDHDHRRPVEFSVLRCVDDAGRDRTKHFAITFESISESPRELRLHVRYLGGLTERLRGSIVLSKDGERGPFLPIELLVFGS